VKSHSSAVSDCNLTGRRLLCRGAIITGIVATTKPIIVEAPIEIRV
jgi:hypothetical protein